MRSIPGNYSILHRDTTIVRKSKKSIAVVRGRKKNRLAYGKRSDRLPDGTGEK